AREQVGGAVPPAGRVGRPRQLEELLPLGGGADAVAGEQVGHVAFLEDDAAELQPADLRGRRADRLARALTADARRLALAPQGPTEADAEHGGAGGGPLRCPAAGAVEDRLVE